MSSCSYSSPQGILSYLDENKFFSFLTTSTFVIIGLFIYIVSLYRYFDKGNIPTIAQPLAPYGNIGDVINKYLTLFELLSQYYTKLKKKGRKYGGMYLFFKPGVVVADHVLIKELLLKDYIFTDINDMKNDEKLLNMSSELFQDLISDTEDIKVYFVNSLEKHKIKWQSILYETVINIVCRIYGVKNDEVTLKFIETTIKELTNGSIRQYLKLTYGFNNLSEKNWKADIQGILLQIKTDKQRKDIIQALIDSPGYDQSILLNNFRNIFNKNIAYCYYTSLLCLYELSQDADIQKELIGEIRRFNSSKNKLNELPYLDAVVKETLRKYPPVPLIIKRCVDNYQTTSGIKINKNNLVLIPTIGIHYDASIYIDPNKFDPDRFLEDDIEKRGIFLPFGMKQNKEEKINNESKITILAMKFILVCIFSNFKLKLKDNNYNLTFDGGKMNIQPAKPFPLEFEMIL